MSDTADLVKEYEKMLSERNRTGQGRLSSRLMLRSSLNDLLKEIEKLIDIAEKMQKKKQRQMVNELVECIDELMVLYKLQDQAARDMEKEFTHGNNK